MEPEPRYLSFQNDGESQKKKILSKQKLNDKILYFYIKLSTNSHFIHTLQTI